MKNSRIKQIINYIIAATLFIALLCFFVWTFQLGKKYNQVQLLLHDNCNIDSVLEMEKQYQSENNITFWKQIDGAIVVNDDLERSVNADVIAVRGDSRVVINEGVPLEAYDSEICVLGKQVAFDLYGTTDIVGLFVSYNGREYEVVDVLDDNKNVFIYEVQAGDTVNFDRVTALVKSDETSLKCINRLGISYGINGDTIDYEFELFAIRFISMIMLVGILIYIVVKMKKYLISKEKVSDNMAGFISVGCVIVYVVVVVVCLGKLSIPLDYIPTGWSDYTFWGDFFMVKATNIRTIMLMKKNVPDYLMYFDVLKFFAGLFLILLIYALRSRVKRK